MTNSSNALSERAILITGGARRVGAAIARRVHAAGARVVLHHRNSGVAAAALAEQLNGVRPASAAVVQADLLQAGSSRQLVQNAIDCFGQLDGLVNNASSFFPTALSRIDEANWHDLIGTNLKAPLFLAQAAAEELGRRQGAIVNITDIHAERPLAGFLLYSVAKTGLLGLTRALAQELGPRVRVNAVAPGPILWPEDVAFDPAERARIVQSSFLKRAGEPDDIARTVLFLLSDAPYITGQVIAVDGGRSVYL